MSCNTPTASHPPRRDRASHTRKEIRAMLLKLNRVLDVTASIVIVILTLGAAGSTAVLGL